MGKRTFTFDLLGASPQKLRKNLSNFAEKDFAFEQGKILNKALKNPNRKERALAFIKGAYKVQNPYQRRMLIALCMYRRADKLEDERKLIMGNSQYTIGVDYQTVLNTMKQNVKTMMGAGDIYDEIRKYAKSNKLWGKGEKQKDKWDWVKKQLLAANFPSDAVNKVIDERKKTLKKHKKERLTKFIDIVKTVGKIALNAAKVIPGVGDAVKAAEKAVTSIPGVKEALSLANKVKGTIKEAKAIGDKLKIEKLKDLGMNPKVVEALNIAQVVEKKIENTVAEVKSGQATSIVNVAEKLMPEKVQIAMKLVKAAQEMNPEALKQIQNIQQLANTGIYEAQKAIQTMKVALNVQNAAKQQALDQDRPWQYW